MNKKSVEKIKAQKEESKYERQIEKLEKEINRLKSENNTLHELIRKNDDFILEMVKDKTVEEIIQQVKEKAEVVVRDKCPNCGTDEMKKINLGTVEIIACTRCSYRNRIHAGNQPA